MVAYGARVILDRVGVERALVSILTRVPSAEFRLVGTASCVLRGIEMPAADIDILFDDRADVDAWFSALSADLSVQAAPTWIADAHQYFAGVNAAGVSIELSTVETETENDTTECCGAGQWRYFDPVVCGSTTVPAVATALRLITELTRSREVRYRPIIDHLRLDGCDLPLIRRGLTNVGATQEVVDRLLIDLAPERGP